MQSKVIPLDSIETKIRSLNGSSFLWGAHHPHCDRYNHHLIWIKGHPYCLGCTSMYIGITLGIPIAVAIDWSLFTFMGWMLFHFILIIFTVIQPTIQKKSYKVFSRLILGMCVTTYWLSGIVFFVPPVINDWLFRFLVIIAFVVGFQTLFRYRNKLIDDPCKACPLGYYPTCDWNLPRLLAENDELRELELLTQLKAGQLPDKNWDAFVN